MIQETSIAFLPSILPTSQLVEYFQLSSMHSQHRMCKHTVHRNMDPKQIYWISTLSTCVEINNICTCTNKLMAHARQYNVFPPAK